jgi:hypothetical protein
MKGNQLPAQAGTPYELKGVPLLVLRNKPIRLNVEEYRAILSEQVGGRDFFAMFPALGTKIEVMRTLKFSAPPDRKKAYDYFNLSSN